MSANRAPFPSDPEDFGSDTRISYSKTTNNYTLEDENGEEWEWFPRTSKWVPMMDEALAEQQREAYKMPGVDDEEPALDPSKKRKALEAENANAKKQKKEQPKERVNTAVYVTNLPSDVTEGELFREFSRHGMIAESTETDKPRIKMYYNDSGVFNGDALIVYLKPESVKQAIHMVDDLDFRFGQPGDNGKTRVKEADQNYKVQKDKPATSGEAKKKGTAANRDREKVIKKAEEMNRRLTEWDEDDVSVLPATSRRWDKVVILKHMFTLEEMKDDDDLVEDLEEDTREECSKLGEVENVVVFDAELQGVITVRFADSTAARACVKKMDGRAYEGRRLEAKLANGTERFYKRGRAPEE